MEINENNLQRLRASIRESGWRKVREKIDAATARNLEIAVRGGGHTCNEEKTSLSGSKTVTLVRER